ncbi:alkaline-phosphatase-like protein [Xylaria sp. CBS 124048]|nr:alkaline-phosphatase-like protein [Xylaria sp. CBS 124048]
MPPQEPIVMEKDRSLLSPLSYDDDAVSLHSRSEQDTDSEDDKIVAAARNSRELRARDRMVLTEEEEMGQLVINSRASERRGSSLQRHGSNLSLPNPILALRSYSKTRPGTASSDAASSIDDIHDEKRRIRRDRRRENRERMLKEARDGEDGKLIHEMEGGTMKDGSSTGDSSDRDSSDELDRQHLLHVSGAAKSTKTRKWRKWILIHATIAVTVALLALVAWKLLSGKKHPATAALRSNGTALFAPTTLIISLDGFRADFLMRGLTPRLNAFIKEGVSPLYMTPSFPSVTFPNHYTLATGLYPENHGIVGNTFWDPEMQEEFYYTDPERSLNPKWWDGEPFWVTAELQGIRTAVHMWPGSEAHIKNMDPSFYDKYNGQETLPRKVDRIMEFLDMPGLENSDIGPEESRPQLIAAYVPNVDSHGHLYGPNSTEIRATINDVDTMLDDIFHGLEKRNLTDIVNVIVVSDHGMATTDVSRMLQLEDLVDMTKVEHLDGWPLVGIRPKEPEDLQVLYEQVAEQAQSNPNFEVYLTGKDMPERYHFSNNSRIAPLWIVPKTGWAIVEKAEFDIEDAKARNLTYHPRGLHGYDHEHPLMRAIFVARGPAFPHQPHSKVEPFQNTNVYNILCDSIGMTPMPNDGTLRLPLKVIGLHDDEHRLEEPEDPVPASANEQLATVTITSILPSATFSPTNDASVDESKRPEDPETSETLVTPETPETPKRPESPTSPRPSDESQEEEESSDDNGTTDDGKGGPWWDPLKESFDWVKDKFNHAVDEVGHFVDKVTGDSSSA